MFQRNVESWIRIIFSCLLTAALTMQPVSVVSALHSSSSLNAQLNYAIVFVSRKIPSNGTIYMSPSQTGSMPGAGPFSRFEVAAPGKLIIRAVDGTLRVLIDGSKPTPASLNLIDVNAPDVSYDASKIVFAGVPAGSYGTGPSGNPGAWRIYMINVDGTGLQQVTFSDQNNLDLSQFKTVALSFKTYDDTDPAWLPDGRIVFSSTRWPSFAQYSGARTSNLYVVNANGTNLHRITSERNGADRPLIDPITGKIVYSRWWRNLRFANNSMSTVYVNSSDPSQGYKLFNGLSSDRSNQLVRPDYLWRNSWNASTINPDGTGLALWTGGGLHTDMDNFAYGGTFTDDGTLIANFFPMNNMSEAAGFGGIRQYLRGPNGYKPIIGVTIRNDNTQTLVSYNPPSFGVYKTSYAADPAALPDGRLIISWAKDTAQDYGLYIINADGTGLTSLYDNPGTTELRAHVIRTRPLPPILQDKITQVASLLPPLDKGPYNVDGTFTFQDLNVYFNAPVDTNILNAMPVGSASTIRFFIDHQRWQQTGSLEGLDWPILLNELPVNSDGSVTATSPANVPLFEQIRTAKPGYTVPLTGNNAITPDQGGAAHVAGMNFGRPGEVVTCVGCHAGHSMIPVPANPADAQWTNLAPGATVSVSSLNSSLANANGLIDRRVKMQVPNALSKYWLSKSGLTPTSQWVQLTFPVPVTVRTVRLYNIPQADVPVQVLQTTVRLYGDLAGTQQIASTTSGALSDGGTNVAFGDIPARVVRVEINAVNGATAGLGEVEVIARAGVNVNSKPDKVTPVSPSGSITTNQPTYTWRQVPNATSYYLWINNSSGLIFKQWYTSAQVDCNGTTCSIAPTGLNLGGVEHTWWVQARNDAGMGSWSDALKFTPPGSPPPTKVNLVSPNGNIGITNPAYTWNDVASATWYYLWITNSSGNVFKKWYTSAQANCNGTVCSVVPTGLTLSAGSYVWAIQAWSDAGYGAWSDSMNFSPAAPGKATLSSPNGNADSDTPPFVWNEVPGATWYYLWINNPSGPVFKQWYTSAQANCDGSTCSIAPANLTMSSGDYNWFIQTWNDVGYGPWSNRMNFHTP